MEKTYSSQVSPDKFQSIDHNQQSFDSNQQRELIPATVDPESGGSNQTQSSRANKVIPEEITFEQEMEKPDPVKGLIWLKQIEINEKIVNSVRTPFDYAQFIQVLRNPLDPEVLITVQLVKPNVFHSTEKNVTPMPEYMTSKNGQPMELVQNDEKLMPSCLACSLCGTQDKQKLTQVWRPKIFKLQTVSKINTDAETKEAGNNKCEIQQVCCLCYAKYYVRRQLDKKASRHANFDPYVMVYQKEMEERHIIETDVCKIAQVTKSLDELEKESTLFKEEQNETVIGFSKLSKHLDFKQNDNPKTKFALLGLWQRSDENSELVCQKQYKIQNPYLIRNSESEEDFVKADFLHLSDNKEVFFFQRFKSEDDKMTLSFLNLEMLLSKVQQTLTDEPHVFQAPLIGEARVMDSALKELLLDAGKKKEQESDEVRTRHFISLKNGFLVFTTKLSVVSLKGYPSQLKTTPTDKWNLVFVDIQTLLPGFIIYGGLLLLKITASSKEFDVWFMEQNHVVNDKFSLFEEFPVQNSKASNSKRSKELRFQIGQLIRNNDAPVKKKKKFNQHDFNDFEQVDRTTVNSKTWLENSTSLWRETNIKGMMHKNNERVTIIFGQINWFTFRIKDTCAYQIIEHMYKNSSNDSAKFVMVKGHLNICTNFNFLEIKNENMVNESYNKFSCNLIDLDQDDESIEVNQDQLQKLQKGYDNYNSRIPRDYCPGSLKLTKVHLTQLFYLEKNGNPILYGAYFHKSLQTNKNGLLFTMLEKQQKETKKLAIQDELVKRNSAVHSGQVLLENQYIINYPLIMYKSYHPLNNVLMLSNFAINEHQKLIDLGSYRFLCFVDSSVPLDETWRKKGESCIFFLVKTRRGNVRLMYYRTFAWLYLQKDQAVPVQISQERQDTIQLVSGNIVISDQYDFSHVKKAILILKSDQINFATILLQSCGNFLAVHFQQPADKKEQLVDLIDHDQSMVPLEAICCQNKTFCLVRSVNSGDEILITGYTQISQQITKLSIYSQNAAILNMQLNPGKDSGSQSQSGIYLLDIESQFRFIAPQETSVHYGLKNELATKFLVKYVVDLKQVYLRSIIEDLIAFPWQGIQISSKAILTSRKLDLASQSYIHSRSVWNINSQAQTDVDNLDYDKDKLNTGVKKKNQHLIHDLRSVPLIGKFMNVVQESKSMYFLLEEDFQEKRVDLMNIDYLNEFVKDIVVLDSHIILYTEWLGLVFSQKDMMLSEIFNLPFQYNEKKNSIQINSPFGYKGKQYVDLDGFLYCYAIGEKVRLVRSGIKENSIMGQLQNYAENWKGISSYQSIIKKRFKLSNVLGKKIKAYLPQIDLEDQIPERFVSPSGSTTWLFKSRRTTQKTQNDLEKEQLYQIKDELLQNQRSRGLELAIARVEIYLDKDGKEIHDQTSMINIIQKAIESGSSQLQKGVACDHDRDEQKQTAFIIQTDEIPSIDQFQILLTRDFLVINTLSQILFVKQSEIEKLEYATSFSKVIFKIIRVDKLFNPDLLKKEDGFKIHLLEDEDFQTVSQTKIRMNCIQISFAEELIMWDLDNNEEISFLTGQSQFLSEENYVRTGFRLQVPIIKESTKPKTLSSYSITTNWDQSLVGIAQPTDSNDHQIVCFRTFTLLDIYEMINIETQLLLQKPIKRIDLDTIFTNVYGRTIFSLFFETPEIHQLILQKISELKLDSYLDERNVEFDNIIVRKLFRVLILPARFRCEKKPSLVFKLHVKGDFTNEPLSQQDDQISESLFCFGEEWITKKSKRVQSFINDNLRPGRAAIDIQKRNHNNLLSIGLNQKYQDQLNALLELMMFSREARFANVIQDYNQFKRLLTIDSIKAKTFIDNSMLQTEMSTGVKQLLWPENKKTVVFGSKTSLLTEQEIIRKFTKKTNQTTYYLLKSLKNGYEFLKNRFAHKFAQHKDLVEISALLGSDIKSSTRKYCNVEVKVVEIEWISNNLRDFFVYLASLNNVNLYDIQLIKVLLNQQDYSLQLFLVGFIPYCVYMGLCLYYFSYILTDSIVTGSQGQGYFVGSTRDVTIRVFILIFTALFSFIELLQALYLRHVYFKDYWNYIQIGSLALNIFIVSKHSMTETFENKLAVVQTASVASIVLWFMLYYWMRLFKRTAFYVLIITETLKDIRPFLVIFMIILCCFASSTLIIQENERAEQRSRLETEIFIPTAIDRTTIDSWVNQYNLLLGNFYTDGFQKNESSAILWIYFILATFFTNVMFLNMLIAVMGDVFSRITEQKEKYGLKEKTELYADYIFALSINQNLRKKRFLYVITLLEDINGDNDLVEGLDEIKHHMKTESLKIEELLVAQENKIRNDINDMNLKQEILQNSVDDIQETLERLSKKLGLEESKDSLFAGPITPSSRVGAKRIVK